MGKFLASSMIFGPDVEGAGVANVTFLEVLGLRVGRGSSLVGPCAWAVIIASNLHISDAMFPCNSAFSAAASACVKPYVVVPFGASRAG